MVRIGDPKTEGQAGYSLVVMVIVITIVNILVAAALPLWSSFAQREREEELIFRGLQYAEAIRVFQKRFGRYPNRLDELVELEPRCLRQLWDDPMSEDGKWGLIFGAAGKRGKGKGQAPGQVQGTGRGSLMSDIIDERRDEAGKEGDVGDPSGAPPGGGLGSGQPGSPQARGPITGVFSKSDESGFKTFFGQSNYRQWRFTAQLVTQSPMGPTGVRTPHIGSRTIGRAFAGEIGQPGAGMPGSQPTGLPGDAPGKGQPGGVGAGSGLGDSPDEK